MNRIRRSLHVAMLAVWVFSSGVALANDYDIERLIWSDVESAASELGSSFAWRRRVRMGAIAAGVAGMVWLYFASHPSLFRYGEQAYDGTKIEQGPEFKITRVVIEPRDQGWLAAVYRGILGGIFAATAATTAAVIQVVGSAVTSPLLRSLRSFLSPGDAVWFKGEYSSTESAANHMLQYAIEYEMADVTQREQKRESLHISTVLLSSQLRLMLGYMHHQVTVAQHAQGRCAADLTQLMHDDVRYLFGEINEFLAQMQDNLQTDCSCVKSVASFAELLDLYVERFAQQQAALAK